MKSIWRGLGHGGVVVTLFLAIVVITMPIKRWVEHEYVGSVNFELYNGFWGSWLLLLSLTVNAVLVTVSCYRAARDKAFWKLILTYVAIAAVMCVVRDRALIAYRNEGFIVVNMNQAELEKILPPGASFSMQRPKPTINELLEPVWIFTVPLVPIIVLWAITRFSRPRSFYPFSDPENTVCLTVRQILNEGSPILLVTHDADDGMWQFLTGGEFNIESAVAAPLGELFARDYSIGSLADLPLGWKATRQSRSQSWHRSEIGAE